MTMMTATASISVNPPCRRLISGGLIVVTKFILWVWAVATHSRCRAQNNQPPDRNQQKKRQLDQFGHPFFTLLRIHEDREPVVRTTLPLRIMPSLQAQQPQSGCTNDACATRRRGITRITERAGTCRGVCKGCCSDTHVCWECTPNKQNCRLTAIGNCRPSSAAGLFLGVVHGRP